MPGGRPAVNGMKAWSGHTIFCLLWKSLTLKSQNEAIFVGILTLIQMALGATTAEEIHLITVVFPTAWSGLLDFRSRTCFSICVIVVQVT